jgi:glucose-1-phosphate cytidylyltransferase
MPASIFGYRFDTGARLAWQIRRYSHQISHASIGSESSQAMKVVILAGGRGTRLSEETQSIPKPMVSIGGRPIIWHIMRHYAAFGFDDFVIALGYKGYVIKEYFANYQTHQNDLQINLGSGEVQVLSSHAEDWKVTLVDTGAETMTGGRVARLSSLLTDTFLLTYGDGLSDVPIDEVVKFHRERGATATVTAVHPPPRFGALEIKDGMVPRFREKPADSHDRINGGFFVIEPAALSLLSGDDCVLETGPLETLAARSELAAYEHDGFWMPMDTLRDRDELNRIWDSGSAPWLPDSASRDAL